MLIAGRTDLLLGFRSFLPDARRLSLPIAAAALAAAALAAAAALTAASDEERPEGFLSRRLLE